MKMDLPTLRRRLLRWYRNAARSFPWRNTRDPYRILVSEIMLQQTQASRVVHHYRAFLRRFPSIRALAAASPGSVLRAWQGLGFNMRAMRLHAIAVEIHRHRSGRFPTTVEGLLELPGIGPYTARAVAIFAFGRAEAVVDTNVRRILRRLFPRSTEESDFQALADGLLASRSSHDWNQAVMELGATICAPTRPNCGICPIATQCPSAGKAAHLRSKRPTSEPRYRGHPRRIYRGRVLSALHRSTGRSAASDMSLARRLFPVVRPGDLPYLRRVLTSLEEDGLIDISRRRTGWIVRTVR